VDATQIMALVGLGVALVIAVMNLRDARRWQKDERRLREPEREVERKPTGFSGPWGD
jgi:hypothetical protein